MTDKELVLVSDLLKMASSQFSNHGCNDFNLLKYLTPEECVKLDQEICEWNGDPEEHDPKWASKGCNQDWLLMRYYADKLKQLS